MEEDDLNSLSSGLGLGLGTGTGTGTNPSARESVDILQSSEEGKDFSREFGGNATADLDEPPIEKTTEPRSAGPGVRGRPRNRSTERKERKERRRERERSQSPGERKEIKRGRPSSCRKGHHSDDEPRLSEKELDRIRHVPALLDLYRFIDSVAGTDRRHYRKCGCVNKMPISHLWNMDTNSPLWRWHNKKIDETKINFEMSYGDFLTGTGRAAIEHALSVVRTCGNPDVLDLSLYTLITDPDLSPQFRGLVSVFLQTGKDPRNYQSVSTLAIKEIIDSDTYYLTWFTYVKPVPKLEPDGVRYRWVAP